MLVLFTIVNIINVSGARGARTERLRRSQGAGLPRQLVRAAPPPHRYRPRCLLQYVDRGVVPGAFESLGTYIQQDIGRSDTDTFTGALQSAFIGGYSVASISFGHLVHKYPPFRLMSVGLGIWVIAVVLSGLAPYIISHNSFWILISARVLSGVGEASFQTVVPPYIDDNAPADKRGLWLSVFYMAIPVGTASECDGHDGHNDDAHAAGRGVDAADEGVYSACLPPSLYSPLLQSGTGTAA